MKGFEEPCDGCLNTPAHQWPLQLLQQRNKQEVSQEGSNLALSAGVFNFFRSAVEQHQSSLLRKPTWGKERELLKRVFFYIPDLNISSIQGTSPWLCPAVVSCETR